MILSHPGVINARWRMHVAVILARALRREEEEEQEVKALKVILPRIQVQGQPADQAH